MRYFPILFLFFALNVNGQKTIIYKSTNEIFANPERGFSTLISRNFSENAIHALDSEYITVIQRIYLLEDFVDTDISVAFLQNIRNDMNVARKTGKKFVVRFSYTSRQTGRDASLERIKRHLDQLKPILVENYDVITYVEAGLIGAWGEWYYSTNKLNNTADRREVLFKILSVLPRERMVVVRTPKYKMDIFNLTAKDWISSDSAFTGSYRARTGAHNDCFLAGVDDMGTYSRGRVEEDKAFLNMDNRFVPMGGETCAVFAPRSECPEALNEMAFIHFSILNRDYNKKVLNSWTCMDDVKRRLGYRFRLVDSQISSSVAAGNTFDIKLNILNDGFASPFNGRRCDLILREKKTGKQYRTATGADPRFWLPGSAITLNISAGIPRDLPAGDYEILLHLGDPAPGLTGRSEYSIRLANEDVWEEQTGYNSLLSSVSVSSKGKGKKYKGERWFSIDNVTRVN